MRIFVCLLVQEVDRGLSNGWTVACLLASLRLDKWA